MLQSVDSTLAMSSTLTSLWFQLEVARMLMLSSSTLPSTFGIRFALNNLRATKF